MFWLTPLRWPECMILLYVGPKEELDSTVISQPAIYVSSLAAIEKLRQTDGEVRECMLRVSLSFLD